MIKGVQPGPLFDGMDGPIITQSIGDLTIIYAINHFLKYNFFKEMMCIQSKKTICCHVNT